MTLTDIQKLRIKISDQPEWHDVTRNGDGTALRFGLSPYRNVTAATAFLPSANTAGWSATTASFNASGYVDMPSIVSANSAFRLYFEESTFSDDECSAFIVDGGGVLGGAIHAVQHLMFDASKRASWGAADGSSYDDRLSMADLRNLYKTLTDELARDGVYGGGTQSWAESQGDY